MRYSFIFFILNLLFCDSYIKTLSMTLELRNNKPSYQCINNLKKIHFSKIEKLALFIYKSGEIDIITQNISIYYKNLYNNSLNNTPTIKKD